MQVWTVSEVTHRVKLLLDSEPELADLWVAGQVSNLHRASSGHWYFSLVDGESELRCVIWKGLATRVARMPAQGDLVDAHGYLSVYERGGAYQFYVDTLEPAGIGDLWEQFARLRARLEAEGLFDAARKRALPRRPHRIGVVTSPTGAALQDILTILRNRYPLVEVVVSPTVVQGVEAPEGIVKAIGRLDRLQDIDAIIVARGGGSLEDLMPFNDEGVARAIAATHVPVVTGIGHETDISIADLVADVRAPTPTGAATVIVPDGAALREAVGQALETLYISMQRRIGELARSLDQQWRLLRTLHPRRLIAEERQRLDDRLDRLTVTVRRDLAERRAELLAAVARLRVLDARQVLSRGYALLYMTTTGWQLSSVAQASADDELMIRLHDGQIDARVESVRPATSTSGETAY